MKALRLYLHMVLFFFSKFHKMKFRPLVEICFWLNLAVKGLRGLYHATCYLFKKLERLSRQLNFKNNGLVLLFKTIFRHWNCFQSSVATDGKDGNGLKLETLGWPFQVLMQCLRNPPPPQITMFSAPPSNVLVSSVASLARFAAMLQNRLRVLVVPFTVDSYVSRQSRANDKKAACWVFAAFL